MSLWQLSTSRSEEFGVGHSGSMIRKGVWTLQTPSMCVSTNRKLICTLALKKVKR